MSEGSTGFQHPADDPAAEDAGAAAAMPLAAPEARRPVNWRSFGVGLVGVGLICALTPYNDFVMGNTYLIGNFLPVGLLVFMLALLMLVNAPLHRWLPRHALSSGELAVVLGMVLIAGTIPASGLMRYLPATLVGLNYHASSGGDRLTVLEELDLPEWMFPTRPGETLREQAGSAVVRDFYGRSSAVAGAESYGDAVAAVPWSAWVTPAITWAIVLIGLYGAILCLMVIVRHQWAENERLAFPLATVYSSLIEAPDPGRALPPLFRSFGFWLTFSIVFALHSINALSRYDPQIWPEIPLGFNLTTLLEEEPFRYINGYGKTSTLYFVIIGFTYFLQSNVAFSLWFIFLLTQVVRMQMGMVGATLNPGMEQDQGMAATLIFGLTILWVGRHHWGMVLQQMVRRPRPGEPGGRYLPYFLAGWGFVICNIIVVAWLMAAGMTLGGALLLLVLLLTFLLVVARVVAETGLIFVQINVPLIRPMIYGLNDLPGGMQVRRPLPDYFFNRLFERLFTHDMREGISPFAINALRVADMQAYGHERRWTRTLPFALALIAALAFGYVVAGASMLYTEYSHASTMASIPVQPINGFAIDTTATTLLDGTRQFTGTGTGPSENHSRLFHFGLGASITAALSGLRLRFANWPLHPVGFLLVYSMPIGRMWFSIMIGWVAKVVLVRYGGASVYRAARPYFIGMIVGEAAVAGFWLVIGLIRNAQGLSYEAINLLPT